MDFSLNNFVPLGIEGLKESLFIASTTEFGDLLMLFFVNKIFCPLFCSFSNSPNFYTNNAIKNNFI